MPKRPPRVLNEVQREKMRDRADRQAVRRSNAVKLAKALQIDPELPIYMPAGVMIYHGRICHVDCQMPAGVIFKPAP